MRHISHKGVLAREAAVGLAKSVVAHVYGVSLEELAARRGRVQATRARQVAMYLSSVVLRMSNSQIAAAFGRDPSTAHYACRRVEELREHAEVDRTLSWLETLVRDATGARP